VSPPRDGGGPAREDRPEEVATAKQPASALSVPSEIRQPAMKAAERAQLMTVANERAKLAKTEVQALAAERIVELNAQLEAVWKAQDFGAEQIVGQMQKLADDVNKRIQPECDRLGILPELRPHMNAYLAGAYTTDKRRVRLRQLLKDENDAAVKRACHSIDVWRTRTREALVRDGLTSTAAIEFLDTLPAPGQLLPDVNVKALAAKQDKP
jgi:hypothetical protein